MTASYFEDVAVGATFRGDLFLVTEEAIIAFAREFDMQPFHLEHTAANRSVFGGLAASGWHTAAIAMRLFTTGPLQFVSGAVGLGVNELRWPVAVRAGDHLQLTTEIVDSRTSRSRPAFGILRIRNVLTNQRSEIVLSYTADAMVRRRLAEDV